MAMPAAKGLFHRAIVQSGAAVKGMPKDAANKNTQTVLSRVNLTAQQIDELQKVPMQKLLDIQEPNAGPPIGFSPVTDGKSLPVDPFDPTAPAQSANIPLLIGTTETEVTFFPNQILDPIDDAALKSNVKKLIRNASDAQVDELIKAYRTGRPRDSNTDLVPDHRVRCDVPRRACSRKRIARRSRRRPPCTTTTSRGARRCEKGKLRSYHTLEILLVFDNIDASQADDGQGARPAHSADRTAKAWARSPRTGNPNHAGLPKWDTYDTTKKATMVFDVECKVVNDPHGAEQKLLRSLQAST